MSKIARSLPRAVLFLTLACRTQLESAPDGAPDFALRADGDGHLDLVLPQRAYPQSPFTVVVRFGDGAGGFPDEARVIVAERTQEIALGDLDGDGRLDLVLAHGERWYSVLLAD